ncbi:MAG: amidohydrolase family protein [Chloroflexi bacterium]|nr:amidohydrolase family protein [Chloroflexota bacterium]
MAVGSGKAIDADGHIRDTEALIRPYLEAPYDKRPRLAMGGSSDGYDNTMGMTLGTRVVDVQVWLDALDQANLEQAVLYPTGSLGSGWLREADFAVARCRAYNEFLSEAYMKVSPRFRGVALLAPQDPVEAAKELRRCVVDLGMVGGTLPEGPYLYGERKYDPIYEEAQRLDVPIAIHGSGRIHGMIEEYMFDDFIQVHSIGHAFTQMKQFVSIVFEGVPARFPDLRVAFLEAGCGWAVYMLDRMDERYHMRAHEEAALLTKSPSEYVADGNIFISLEADERLLPETMRLLGDDIFVYASDFPHWDAAFPGNIQHLLARTDLTEEQRRKITRDNAVSLYRLS